MIISKTPFRISFFGGGTDYPAWYREHGGAVLATSIDKYCYISCRTLPPFFEYRHRIVYSKTEFVTKFEDIQHPAVRAVLMEMDSGEGLEIHHDADLPARSGLGSSSSFTVGMLNTMNAHRGRYVSKHDLAMSAIRIEQNVIQETVGSQDQVTAAYGGFNKIDFKRDDSFEVTPVIMSHERRVFLEDSFLLFFTGFTRFATEIAETKVKNFATKTSELRTMFQMVGEAEKTLQKSTATSFEDFGRLLDESWKLKRSLSDAVSTNFIDEAYEAGIKAGATGGKLLGAGGGGFMVFFVKPEQRKNVLNALKKLLHVQFKFDTSGSKIALYDPNMV